VERTEGERRAGKTGDQGVQGEKMRESPRRAIRYREFDRESTLNGKKRKKEEKKY